MKRLFFAIACLSLCAGAFAQAPSDAKARRQEKKAAENALDKARHDVAAKALADNLYVLHADLLYFQNGGTATVEPAMNFIMLEGDKITVQVSLARYGAGSGITLEGRVVKTQKKTDRKGRTYYRYDIQATERSLTRVNVTLEAGSAQASGVVYSDSNYNTFRSNLSNYRDRNITLNGTLDPAGSGIIRGKPLF